MRRIIEIFRTAKNASISRKYGIGYLIVLFAMSLLFVTSLGFHSYISKQYENELDDLLGLNLLFADVEECNVHLFDSVTYLRPFSFAAFEESAAVTQSAADDVYEGLHKDWNRDTADLYFMVNTYLDKGLELTDILADYHGDEPPVENSHISRLYSESQELVSYINISFKDIYSGKLLSTQQMRQSMTVLDKAFFITQIVLLALSFFVFFLFYRRVILGLTQSVNKLTEFAQRVKREPAGDAAIQLNTGDELEVFADTFSSMMRTIRRQFEQIEQDSRVREQLQAAEMENMRITSALQSSQLSLLQARINPHFLFNTLNMIAQTAYLENAGETAHLMECTANYLRYNLGSATKPVALGEEIANLREYAYIQKSRFGERVDFHFAVQEDTAGLQMPCMILQPLVENSVSHGIGHRPEGGAITVRSYMQDWRVLLEVEDNGDGIAPERLAELREALTGELEPGGQHIGLKNVYMRLKLYFNNDVKFTIDSRAGYTLVRISLPQAPGTRGGEGLVHDGDSGGRGD